MGIHNAYTQRFNVGGMTKEDMAAMSPGACEDARRASKHLAIMNVLAKHRYGTQNSDVNAVIIDANTAKVADEILEAISHVGK